MKIHSITLLFGIVIDIPVLENNDQTIQIIVISIEPVHLQSRNRRITCTYINQYAIPGSLQDRDLITGNNRWLTSAIKWTKFKNDQLQRFQWKWENNESIHELITELLTNSLFINILTTSPQDIRSKTFWDVFSTQNHAQTVFILNPRTGIWMQQQQKQTMDYGSPEAVQTLNCSINLNCAYLSSRSCTRTHTSTHNKHFELDFNSSVDQNILALLSMPYSTDYTGFNIGTHL